MRKSRFTEKWTIGLLKKHQVGRCQPDRRCNENWQVLTEHQAEGAMSNFPINCSYSNLLELYKLHRCHVEQENNLINCRTTWFATIQAVLIPTFGFCFQKKYEIVVNLMSGKLPLDRKDLAAVATGFDMLFFILSCAGLLTALGAIMSVKAATRSIVLSDYNWEIKFSMQNEEIGSLPSMIGARGGFVLPHLLPYTLIIFWLAALLLTVSRWGY